FRRMGSRFMAGGSAPDDRGARQSATTLARNGRMESPMIGRRRFPAGAASGAPNGGPRREAESPRAPASHSHSEMRGKGPHEPRVVHLAQRTVAPRPRPFYAEGVRRQNLHGQSFLFRQSGGGEHLRVDGA